MRIIIIFLALLPFITIVAVFLDGLQMGWFESIRQGLESTFGFRFPEPVHRLYFLSKLAGMSALSILIMAFWVNPLRTYLRFDLVEFKKLLGAFAVGYALLHLLLFIAAHHFSLPMMGKLFLLHPFLAVGLGALLVLSIAPQVKSWYRLIYIGVVLVIIHLLLGYRSLDMFHIVAISLLSLGLALRLVKR